MLRGVSLAQHLLPIKFVEQEGLVSRLADRGGEKEYQFLWLAKECALPIWTGDVHRGGQLRIVRWGCGRGESRWLPCIPTTQLSTVEDGTWKPFNPRQVDIPASLVLDSGVWVALREGIRGLMVTDERGMDRVYVIVEPSSYYYRVMTRANWMPVLIGERI